MPDIAAVSDTFSMAPIPPVPLPSTDVSGTPSTPPVLAPPPPSAEAIEKALNLYKKLKPSEDPKSYETPIDPNLSLPHFIQFMIDKNITINDLAHNLNISGEKVIINIASNVRTAFYRIACEINKSRLLSSNQIINKQKNLEKRVADILTKAEATLEECGVPQDIILNPDSKLSAGEAYKNPKLISSAFVFDPKKTLNGTTGYFNRSLARFFPEDRLPAVFAALGLPNPFAPIASANPAPTPVIVSTTPDALPPAASKNIEAPQLIPAALPHMVIDATPDNLQKAARLYKRIDAAEDPDAFLRPLLRLVIDKKISFADIGRIDGLSGEALFIKLSSLRKNGHFRIARNLMGVLRDIDIKRATKDRNDPKYLNNSNQIVDLRNRVATALHKSDASPQECGINIKLENDNRKKWDPGKAYQDPRFGPQAFYLKPGTILQGSVEYYEDMLNSIFSDENERNIINTASKEFLTAPVPAPQDPAASALAPIKEVPLPPSPQETKTQGKRGWPKGVKRGTYMTKKKIAMLAAQNSNGAAPTPVPLPPPPIPAPENSKGAAPSLEPVPLMPDFDSVPAPVSEQDNLDPVAQARALCASLKTSKDPKPVFTKLVGLIVDNKVRLEDLDETGLMPVDEIKIKLAEQYRNGLLRIARENYEERKKTGPNKPGYKLYNNKFLETLDDLHLSPRETEALRNILENNKRLEGSVAFYNIIFDEAVARCPKTNKQEALPPPPIKETPAFDSAPSDVNPETLLFLPLRTNPELLISRENEIRGGSSQAMLGIIIDKGVPQNPEETKPEITKPTETEPKITKKRGRKFSEEHKWKSFYLKAVVKELCTGPCNEGVVYVIPQENKSPMETHRERLALSKTRTRVVSEFVP